MKMTIKALHFTTPIMLWLGSSLVIAMPDIFSRTRMADRALYFFFGIFAIPMQIASFFLGFYTPVVPLILVFLLLFPLAKWVTWPLISQSRLTMRSYVYIYILVIYMLPSAIFCGVGYIINAKANVFGMKYPELRYLEYKDYIAVEEEDISQVITFDEVFETSTEPITRYVLQIHNGSVYPVDEDEKQLDWGLRKMLQAPTEGYVPSLEYGNIPGRQLSKRYFYFKVGNNFGKGVVYGDNIARLFLSKTGSPVFSTKRKNPSLSDWISWYFTQDKSVYIK